MKYLTFQSVTRLVRSEGGEDVSNFNNLPRWVKGEVHFPPIGAFQAGAVSLAPRLAIDPVGAVLRGDIFVVSCPYFERYQSETTCLRYGPPKFGPIPHLQTVPGRTVAASVSIHGDIMRVV